ncbi:hypothetical protein [uncultured Clostridium sp.]|uniref:hypothetical protein n=1 Tax=uncultured Clostridium sp. TaxID=59620 RepID=UPI00263541B8|nr:hypothetical protein [uncultured Clostridium sp.]
MKIVRNYIEYSGLADYIPTEISGFKDFIVDKDIIIGNEKANIEYFTRCNAIGRIEKKRILNSYANKNYGQEEIENKYKLMVDGNIQIRSEYVGENYEDMIFTDRVKIPFSTVVEIVGEYDPCMKIVSTVFIEDISVKKISENKYRISLGVLVIVEY